jgi:tripartite-type tricarboxylate transporter receptor subunit TctC
MERTMKTMKQGLFETLGMLLVLSLLHSLSAAAVAAADYPSKPVRMIIPAAPGGGADIVGRLFAIKLSERLRTPVVVENHGGAGGVIGEEMVAKAAPDGYTLTIVSGTGHCSLPAFQKLPYDAVKSFTMVAKLASGFTSLTVHPSVPAKSVKELIALAKKTPGELIFVSTGVGSIVHLATELFKTMADIDVKVVQFKGGGPAMVDLIGGHSHAMMGGLSTALPGIQSGKVRVLATGGVKRCSLLPDVPTIAEAGLPGFDVTQWSGLLGPAGLPAPIVNRLNQEIKAILSSPEMDKQLERAGVEADYMGPIEFAPLVDKEIVKWANVVKRANIKLEEQ